MINSCSHGEALCANPAVCLQGCPLISNALACHQVASVDSNGDVTKRSAVLGGQSVERVSFLPSASAANGSAPAAATEPAGKAGGEGPATEAPPPLASKIQAQVSAPLGGVQTALIMDVPLWEHTKTFRSLSRGLYVMPKARHPGSVVEDAPC